MIVFITSLLQVHEMNTQCDYVCLSIYFISETELILMNFGICLNKMSEKFNFYPYVFNITSILH